MSGFELQPPPIDADGYTDAPLWSGETFDVVPLDVPNVIAMVDMCGFVCRFNDAFTTYTVRHASGVALVTVYASNADGALCKGDVDEKLRAAIAGRYGIHRWSEAAWKEGYGR